jgi:hypothetical protein
MPRNEHITMRLLIDGAIDLVTPARVKCAGVFDEIYTFYTSVLFHKFLA